LALLSVVALLLVVPEQQWWAQVSALVSGQHNRQAS
jgi:hypothetical protein